MTVDQRNLKGLDPAFRPKVERILLDMEKYLGYRCYVASGRRTEAQQRKLVDRGYSKTMKSKHLKGRAADIVPVEFGYNPPPDYWLKLGYLADREGLKWGGFFGLPMLLCAALAEAYTDKRWQANVKRGWDPSHVEMP